MPDLPVKIPVPDRYGTCEAATCYGRGWHYKRKPMWVFDGQRLCDECCRNARRAVGV